MSAAVLARGVIDPVLLGSAAALRRKFRGARPFEHLILDGFLDPELCAAVSAEFPHPDKMRLTGDDELGWRAIFRDPAAAGPATKTLERSLQSAAFLRWLAVVAGHSILLRNPEGTCGGLFQDAHGHELDPHLDVNCTVSGHRRRLTLLLYLNSDWQESWGGRLELYPGASRPASAAALPLFNRAVLLASHERAWHGTTPIALPPTRRSLGRRTLIVNFYGPAKPRGDAPAHYNVWRPRPLPARVRGGGALSGDDAAEIRRLLARRDRLLRELRLLEAAKRSAAAPPLPPLPEHFATGYTLTRSDYRELERLFSRRDRELNRLFSLEYKYRRVI